MGSQYPAEQPGNTSSILNTQDSILDSRTDLLPTVPAPVAAVTNLDALTLDTHPGMPNVQQISPAISKKGKKEKKVREKGVSYFSLYRSVVLCMSSCSATLKSYLGTSRTKYTCTM